jgi:hypothetical protein
LLTLFSDVEHAEFLFAGIQRTALDRDAQKLPIIEPRLTLGRWPTPRAIKLWAATATLTIGEGVETVLAAVQLGAAASPAWAMGPKDGVAAFPVLPNVKRLTVLVDNDDPQARAGAEACRNRWLAAGRTVRLLRACRGKDFNDVVRR